MLLRKYENKFYNILDSINSREDQIRLSSAYLVAKNAHKWQKRKSWDSYITHPLAVGISLWDKFKNLDLFISWLLHDSVEDCEDMSIDFIYKEFWVNVWFIVDSVTKTEKTFLWKNKIFENVRDKILFWWIQNIWCILVKLADREHNLSTLSYMPKDKQIKKSFESQAIYLPLMSILKFNESNISLQESTNLLKKYLLENNIKTSKCLKKSLLNTCFHDFSEDIFDVVYQNSNNVIWRIRDKKIFNWLMKSGWFDSDSVDVKSITSDTNWSFNIDFIFKSASTFDLSNWKISISSSRFIS